MAVNNCYISNNSGLVTLTLPASFSVGDIIRVVGLGSGGWKIAQNASQQIDYANTHTTNGITGYVASSTSQYASCDIKGIVANTEFVIISSYGTLAFN
jgi:hypothetical protein